MNSADAQVEHCRATTSDYRTSHRHYKVFPLFPGEIGGFYRIKEIYPAPNSCARQMHFKFHSSTEPSKFHRPASKVVMKIATICCSIFIGIFLASCSAHDRASAPNVITIISCKRAQSYEISRTFAPKGMKAVGKNLDCDIPRNVIVIKISDAEYEYASKYLKYIDSESFSDDKIMYDPQRIIVDSEFTYSNSRTNIDNSSFGDIKKMKNLIDLNWYHNLSGRDFSGSVYPRSLGSGVAAFRRSEYAKRNGIALCVKKMSAFYVSGSDVVFPIEDSDIIRLCIDDVIKEELP